MKVLYMNTFSVVHGGAERLLFDTCTELLELGHRISIVFANDDRSIPVPEYWPARINRYYIPELKLPLHNRKTYDRHRRSPLFREGMRYLQDIITIESPDVIHVHNFPSLEIFKDLEIDVPLVRTVHSYENLCQNQLKCLPNGSICEFPLGEACRTVCGFEDNFRAVRVRCENKYSKLRFARFIAISTYIYDLLTANGFPTQKLRLLPNFSRLTQEPTDVIEEDRVLFVGRITPEKGLIDLIRSISRVPQRPILHIVGKDGILGRNRFQEELVREAERLRVELDLNDWIFGESLRAAYGRSKVVAFSSVWPEPFGLVGIEAMLQEKPVVAFDTGGVRDWLKHEKTGYLVPCGDLNQYAARIEQLLSDDSLRREMGKTARIHALENFTARRYMRDLLNIYTEAINEGSADRSGRQTATRDTQCRTGVFVQRSVEARS